MNSKKCTFSNISVNHKKQKAGVRLWLHRAKAHACFLFFILPPSLYFVNFWHYHDALSIFRLSPSPSDTHL